ncbi:hypothetical protein ACFYYR_00640 [Streptomyces sp. NPDC001922]|uniref:hypothetical protein n=1 Tax=Streptomyces sp. NPDC001922 TaxID=3364624 RepID=UPI0036AF44BE
MGTAGPYVPRLGDLAQDTARDGRIGIVVTLPGPDAPTYHLRTPDGGAEWSAPADGTSLRPVPAEVTHVTPMKRDAVYDHRAQQGALPVLVHYEDGNTSDSVLVMTPAQLEVYHLQLSRIIELRDMACGADR